MGSSSPIYKDGKLYLIDGFGAGSHLFDIGDDFTSVKKIWTDTIMDDYLANPVLIDGRLYGSARHKKEGWCCFDWETGVLLYNDTTMKAGSIVFADGLFYCFAG